MNKNKYIISLFAVVLLLSAISAKAGQGMALAIDNDSTAIKVSAPDIPETSIIDEVIWVVGDEPILKSDVEVFRMQAEQEGMKWNGDPDCAIPEQLAVQKLFLHQAAIDSLEVTESDISQGVEDQLNRWIQLAGSQEKLEEYQMKSISQIRQDLRDDYKNSQLVQKMRMKLVEDVTVTPADVRNYFKDVPEDSIPYVPTEVEVEIITLQPKISIEEINRVKDQLREYTERVTKGETTFATLALLYSEDSGSARKGGELGYVGRVYLDPAFANVAFNLTDPKKISKIVESEFGYHIIQLIDKRGDKVNVRHILRKPQVTQEAIEQGIARLDSIADDIRDGKFTFEEGATFISDDKDTKNNHGLMSNVSEEGRSSRFQMKDLPMEVARVVDTLKVGQVSKAFTMVNARTQKQVCAIVKLKNRVEEHRATITEDFQVMKAVVLEKRRTDAIKDWLADKIKRTYVRMNDRYKDCEFEYQGWVK
ncbi:MAG: peptidylprolyl isomerase [Prevotella sp.]|nr:peptidylprolyl isomerase [Prevotella sp.]